MSEMTMIQARVSKEDKAAAVTLLDSMGLNMSTFINMALKQLIRQRAMPFEVKVNGAVFEDEELVDEIRATMAMEGMALTDEDVALLQKIEAGEMTTEQARRRILKEVKNGR